MAKSPNRVRLEEALAKLCEERRRGGAKVTVAAVLRLAGVPRSAATRDEEFLRLAKRSATEADEVAAAVPEAPAGPTRKERIADLRQTNNDMANLIQALSLTYAQLEAKYDAVRAAASGGKVVPLRGAGRNPRG